MIFISRILTPHPDPGLRCRATPAIRFSFSLGTAGDRRIICATMETNDTALFEILADLIENLEWATQEIQRLQGAVESSHHTRQAYLAGVGEKADDVHLDSIRELRQRVVAIRRDLR